MHYHGIQFLGRDLMVDKGGNFFVAQVSSFCVVQTFSHMQPRKFGVHSTARRLTYRNAFLPMVAAVPIAGNQQHLPASIHWISTLPTDGALWHWHRSHRPLPGV